MLGAPNVVRGGSHNGAIGAEDAIRDEKCTVLASDYYYPAPLQAALALDERGSLPLETGLGADQRAHPPMPAALTTAARSPKVCGPIWCSCRSWARGPSPRFAGGRLVYRSV